MRSIVKESIQTGMKLSLPEYLSQQEGLNVKLWVILAFGIYLTGSFLVALSAWTTPLGVIAIAFAMNQFYRCGYSCSSLLSNRSLRTNWQRYVVGQLSLLVLLRPMTSLYMDRPPMAGPDHSYLGWMFSKLRYSFSVSESQDIRKHAKYPFLWVVAQFCSLGVFAAIFFSVMVINIGWSGLLRHWCLPFVLLHLQLGTFRTTTSKMDIHKNSKNFLYINTVQPKLVKISCRRPSKKLVVKKLVPPAKKSDEKLLLKIGTKWVDLTKWKYSHPGGTEILERMNNADCTEMFNSLHSAEAKARVGRMRDAGPPRGYNIDSDPSKPNKKTLSFRALRVRLEHDGWFERNWLWDTFYIVVMLTCCIVGTFLKDFCPCVAILLIGVGMQQAGWIGHDYVHGRGSTSYVLGRLIGGLVNGFSSKWWSDKHNKHHCHTNQQGIDDDIANDPILHLHIPHESNDFWFRKYQHYYYHFAYTALYASWRTQSFKRAWVDKNPTELLLMAINYAWLWYLGWFVALGSVIAGGWFVAEVVTATHQSEEIIDGISYQFAEDQFRTTRDVRLGSALANWYWGGMQWQLEHHLFPTMPKYRYAALSKILQQWAKDNGVSYRTSSAWEILKMNFRTMRAYSSISVEDFKKLDNPHNQH